VAYVYTGQPPLLVARPLVDNRVPLTCCPTPRWGRRATRYSVKDPGLPSHTLDPGLPPRPWTRPWPAKSTRVRPKKDQEFSQDDNTDTHVDPEPQITTASTLVR
jgi:hypothetical protein